MYSYLGEGECDVTAKSCSDESCKADCQVPDVGMPTMVGVAANSSWWLPTSWWSPTSWWPANSLVGKSGDFEKYI